MAEPTGTIGPELAAAWLRKAARRLAAGGIEGGERDARLLLSSVTGLSALDLIRDPSLTLQPDALAGLADALARRLAHEPVSRIAGERQFFGRAFHVTPATLDPRPETETLIEAVRELAAEEGWTDRPARLLDIGTGTGCLAVTLLAELPLAHALATDVSGAALQVARRNALRHGVADRLEMQCTDLLDGVQGPFDLAVSNPPYISSVEMNTLEPAVRRYDPHAALDGGADGLSFYRRIADRIHSVVPNGWVVLEVGAGQADSVTAIVQARLGAARARGMRRWSDLGGHVRAVAFRTHIGLNA